MLTKAVKLGLTRTSLRRCLLVSTIFLTPISNGSPLITDEHISNDKNTSDWLAYGRTHSEQRFSPIDQIDLETVKNLGVSWYLDLPFDVGLVATPLVAEGVLYFPGSMNIVRAVDAKTGTLLWSYDPEVGKEIAGRKQVGYSHNRGLSIYGDKLFLSTWDGRLIALNRKTGEKVWSTRTFDINEPRWVTSHPKAFKGKVLLGNGGSETGRTRGYVSAYDTETGDLAWRFYIVPGNPANGFESPAMEMAAKTWSGEWWKHGGGGHSWHGFTYDDELDVLYIGTGNGSPWSHRIRSSGEGDNLFLCSIVALDPDTGEYLWHYQTTPGESWDYNSSMDIVLADLEIKGETVKALMHAPKNGFFYVINRATGKLISAEKFADVNWASHVDIKTGRPVELEGARYDKSSAFIMPGPTGAHTWHAMSYSPITKLVYLPTTHSSIGMDDTEIPDDYANKAFDWGFGVNFTFTPPIRDYDGSLQAWDPVAQKAEWEIPQKTAHAAGTLVTSGGIVFQGAPDGVFAAAQQVVELVDEVDDCVAEFHLGGRGRTLLRDENSGPSNLTLETKKVSADHKVRILIPQATGNAKSDNKPSKDDAAPCSLEGPLDGVKKALKALVEIASRKVEKKPQEPQVPQVEKCVSVPATRLRTVARRGQQQPVYRVVARYSGTQVAKRPRDQPIPEDAIVAREPEDALSQAALTVESVVEACTEEPTKITTSVISHVLPDENIDNDDFEDPGCSEDESSTETDASDEDDDEEVVEAEPSKDRIGFMVRGGEKNVDAACQALVSIVEGSSVKDVVAQLKVAFPTAASRRGGRGGGKENPPGTGRRSRG